MKNRITGKDLGFIFGFSAALSFSLFIFNQIDVIIGNPSSFPFSAGEVFFVLFLVAAAFFAFISVVLLILFIYTNHAFKIVVALLLGLMIAGYFQVLFLNGNMISFQDTTNYVPWSAGLQTFAMLLWLVVFFAPLFLLYAHKISGLANKIKEGFFTRFVVISCIVVVTMQSVGLGAAAISADSGSGQPFYFSVRQQLTLSQDENIVVFVLDRLPIWKVDMVFESDPTTKDIFDGFTFYRNNLSEYRFTFPSVLSMLTGVEFESFESREALASYAWENATLFDEMADRGWTRNALLDLSSTFIDVENIDGQFCNLVIMQEGEYRKDIYNRDTVWRTGMIALQRVVPYPLKRMITRDWWPWSIPSLARSVPIDDPDDYFPNHIWADADRLFAQRLKDFGLQAINDGSTFSFIHLNGAHTSSRELVVPQLMGNFEMIDMYLGLMSDEVFYNSTIMIMTDHGSHIMNEHEARYYGFISTLMIKERGVPRSGALQVDTTTPLSNANFLPTMFELIRGESIANSFFDIIDRGARPDRFVSAATWSNSVSQRTVVDPAFVPLTPFPFPNLIIR